MKKIVEHQFGFRSYECLDQNLLEVTAFSQRSEKVYLHAANHVVTKDLSLGHSVSRRCFLKREKWLYRQHTYWHGNSAGKKANHWCKLTRLEQRQIGVFTNRTGLADCVYSSRFIPFTLFSRGRGFHDHQSKSLEVFIFLYLSKSTKIVGDYSIRAVIYTESSQSKTRLMLISCKLFTIIFDINQSFHTVTLIFFSQQDFIINCIDSLIQVNENEASVFSFI